MGNAEFDPFDELPPAQATLAPRPMGGDALGVIVRGSLSKGLELKLDPSVSLETLRAGMFAVVGGELYDFFSLVTDLELTATNPEAVDAPPPAAGSLLRQVLAGDSLYTRAMLRPHLMVKHAEKDREKALLPVKTIPGHFSAARRATPEDVERVFGSEAQSSQYFHIGEPLEMDDIPICLDLGAFVERSNGIFGKSGTGKTFLTRMVLCGLVYKQAAVNLIFDMHGEYGWRGTQEGPVKSTKGLRELYPDRVQVFTLDPRAGSKYDHALCIKHSFLEPEDILSLQKVLSLTPTSAENSYLLRRKFGGRWFSEALKIDPKEITEGGEAHEGAMLALKRKLVSLAERCSSFLRSDEQVIDDAIPLILRNLEQGIHTVIDFGRYNSLIHYILVANILTRRIDAKWREQTELHLQNPNQNARPPQVVITIEEAHKFLEPGIAEQTIFGRIARELRKYNVTLLVVDQRPSQIQKEVLSQLGTKFCCLLDDESDVEAVLSGTSGSGGLRSVLASLDTRQQALVFGHALPMPVVVNTRRYDEGFWSTVGYEPPEVLTAQAIKDRELWD